MSEVESLLIQLRYGSEGKKFKSIKYCGVVFPIKQNVSELSNSDLKQIDEALKILGKFIDFCEIKHRRIISSRWTKDELYDFIKTAKSKQKEILRILAKHGKLGGKELFQKLFPNLEFDKHKMWGVSGKIAGLHRRARNLGKNDLVHRERERTVNGYKYQYWLSPQYELWIKEYFTKVIGRASVPETEQVFYIQAELRNFLTE